MVEVEVEVVERQGQWVHRVWMEQRDRQVHQVHQVHREHKVQRVRQVRSVQRVQVWGQPGLQVQRVQVE